MRWPACLIVSLVPAAWFLGCGMPTTPPPAPTDEPEGRVVATVNQVQAVPVILPPLIDGRLEEGIWRDTPGYRAFGLVDDLATRARHGTTFRIAYDAANLYVAVECDTQAGRRVQSPPRLDDDLAIRTDESCCIRLWPDEGDPSVWYEVAVNCSGAVCDLRRHACVPFEAVGWNGPTQAEVTQGLGRWTVELRIPLRRLGVAERPWRLSVHRRNVAADEHSALHATGAAGPWPPTRVRLTWPVAATPIFAAPSPVRTQSIADMEADEITCQTGNARVLRSLDHALEGRAALRVTVDEGGGWIRLTPPTSNFTGWDTLRFGVYRAGPEAVDLGVRLTDVLGRSRTGWVRLTDRASDVALPMDLLAPGLQLRNVMRLEFVLNRRAVLWIDDVRLIQDALSPHERPEPAPNPIASAVAVSVDPALSEALTPPRAVVVVVDVPLYRTQRVRRLWRCVTDARQPIVWPAGLFEDADAAAPIRLTACVAAGGRAFFARRDVRPAGGEGVVTFLPEHFAGDAPWSTLTRTAQP